MKNNIKSIFIDGPVSPSYIAKSIESHQKKMNIGAHEIFLGQVRADEINQSCVSGIEYSTDQEMANQIAHQIREEAFSRFHLVCMHIYHSVGLVPAGQICLFVFVSSAHRKEAQQACSWIVEKIKAELPVWGKEILENQESVWKINN